MAVTSTEFQLSPAFRGASRLSRALALILRLGFWATFLLCTVLVGLAVLRAANLSPLPDDAVVSYNSPQIKVASLSFWSMLGIAAAFLMKFGPSSVALHFGQRAFAKFAKGEVFTAATIADIRAASLWMMAVAFATSVDQSIFNVSVGLRPVFWINLATFSSSLNLGILFFGACTYVAAYAMAEARRIADDNASFI